MHLNGQAASAAFQMDGELLYWRFLLRTDLARFNNPESLSPGFAYVLAANAPPRPHWQRTLPATVIAQHTTSASIPVRCAAKSRPLAANRRRRMGAAGSISRRRRGEPETLPRRARTPRRWRFSAPPRPGFSSSASQPANPVCKERHRAIPVYGIGREVRAVSASQPRAMTAFDIASSSTVVMMPPWITPWKLSQAPVGLHSAVTSSGEQRNIRRRPVAFSEPHTTQAELRSARRRPVSRAAPLTPASVIAGVDAGREGPIQVCLDDFFCGYAWNSGHYPDACLRE